MILKVQRYNMEQNWWIIDNIKKISTTHTLLKRPGCENHAEIVLFDVYNDVCKCTSEEGACANCIKYIRLICRSNDGNEFCVVFDTTAYILNDNGKTIEKLVANDPE